MNRLLLAFVLVATTALAAQELIVTPSITKTTGTFIGLNGQPCEPEGSGGDPILNKLKNRDKPGSSATPMTIQTVVSTSFPLAMSEGERDRTAWLSEDAMREILAWEGRYV